MMIDKYFSFLRNLSCHYVEKFEIFFYLNLIHNLKKTSCIIQAHFVVLCMLISAKRRLGLPRNLGKLVSAQRRLMASGGSLSKGGGQSASISCVERIYFFYSPKHFQREGGQEKCVLYSTMEKLPFQEYFYIQGHSFQFGANLCGKNLKFIFQEQILLMGEKFLVGGNLKSLFKGKFCF